MKLHSNMAWPAGAPQLAARDQSFPPLSAFDSPFRFAPMDVRA
jgi:hypothetical protein